MSSSAFLNKLNRISLSQRTVLLTSIILFVFFFFVTTSNDPRYNKTVSESSTNHTQTKVSAKAFLRPADLPKGETKCFAGCCVETVLTENRLQTNLEVIRQGLDRTNIELDKLSISLGKLLGDFLYGTLPRPETYSYRIWDAKYIPCLPEGFSVYVETPNVGKWFREEHKKFNQSYILITGDSDGSAFNVANDYRNLLADKQVTHWFAHNCNLPRDHPLFQSGKLTCFPLGLSQWGFSDSYQTKWIASLHEKFPQVPASGWMNFADLESKGVKSNKKLIVGSFNPGTNTGVREPLKQRMVSGDWKAFSEFVSDKKISELYEIISTFKFGLSPFGNGVDCYRTYELLHLGVIPIVLKSTLDPVYEGLPILIVEDWNRVTVDLLQKTWIEFKAKKYDPVPLYKTYWESLVYSYRNWTGPEKYLNYTLKP